MPFPGRHSGWGDEARKKAAEIRKRNRRAEEKSDIKMAKETRNNYWMGRAAEYGWHDPKVKRHYRDRDRRLVARLDKLEKSEGGR